MCQPSLKKRLSTIRRHVHRLIPPSQPITSHLPSSDRERNPQLSSKLLTLPYELREKIYTYLLHSFSTSRLQDLHVDARWRPTRLRRGGKLWTCEIQSCVSSDTPSESDSVANFGGIYVPSKKLKHGLPHEWGWDHSLCQQKLRQRRDFGDGEPHPFEIHVLAFFNLMKTCRITYHEMSEILFTKTTFNFQKMEAIELFLKLTPTYWQNHIRNIHLSLTIRVPLYFPNPYINSEVPVSKSDILAVRKVERRWESICESLVKMDALRGLDIVVWHGIYRISEQRLLSPLLDLTHLTMFDIQLPWAPPKEPFTDDRVVPWELRRMSNFLRREYTESLTPAVPDPRYSRLSLFFRDLWPLRILVEAWDDWRDDWKERQRES